jgi:putative thioredoxin
MDELRDRIFDASDSNFETDVVERSNTVPIVIDFHASWCQPCLELEPILRQAVESGAGAFRVARVDIDEDPALTRRYKVRTIPTLLAMRGGEVVSTLRGLQTADELQSWIRAEVVRPIDPPKTDQGAKS